MRDADRGPILLDIARAAIAEGLGRGPMPRWQEPWLTERAATFVTLHLEERLRGCIGSIDPRRALGEDVAGNARAAAFRDPRFEPVRGEEFAGLAIEVSVLSPRTAVEAPSEAEAVRRLRPGVDGVYLEYAGHAATFLPQVWESLPDPVDFLAALRHKAELPARFWDPAIRLTRYTVEKYVDGHPAS